MEVLTTLPTFYYLGCCSWELKTTITRYYDLRLRDEDRETIQSVYNDESLECDVDEDGSYCDVSNGVSIPLSSSFHLKSSVVEGKDENR